MCLRSCPEGLTCLPVKGPVGHRCALNPPRPRVVGRLACRLFMSWSWPVVYRWRFLGGLRMLRESCGKVNLAARCTLLRERQGAEEGGPVRRRSPNVGSRAGRGRSWLRGCPESLERGVKQPWREEDGGVEWLMLLWGSFSFLYFTVELLFM